MHGRSKRVTICRWGQLISMTAALALFFIGAVIIPSDKSSFAFPMFGCLAVFFAGIFFSLENIRDRFLLITFQSVILVFLMGRPILNIFMGRRWYEYFSTQALWFAIGGVTLSLILISTGCYLAERLYRRKPEKVLKDAHLAPRNRSTEDFRLVSLLAYLFCMVFFLMGEADKLTFMSGRDYVDFYTQYRPRLPFFVASFSAMMPLALAVYLSTLPKKRPAFRALLLYILSAIPRFIIGIRNPMVLNCLVALLYYVFRDVMADEETWVGKWEKRLLIVVIPLGAFALSAYNYIRDGQKLEFSGFFSSIVDLFYKQGVTFNVLAEGYDSIGALPTEGRCFTFGPFIDYLQRNRLGTLILGLEPFPPGNSQQIALHGNYLAHALSYAIRDDYLQGHGLGSSYILECYIDFGWIGVILANLVLGFGLGAMVKAFPGGWLTRSVILVCLTSLFFVPRAETTGWLVFLIQPHFWLVAGTCVAGCLIFEKLQVRKVCRRLFLREKKEN